jgi:hypothetical protein
MPNTGNQSYFSTSWYPPVAKSYEKYTQAERIMAMKAAASAVTRISSLLSPGINKMSMPARMGVKTITLKMGNCILHLRIISTLVTEIGENP